MWHKAKVLFGQKTGRTIGFPTVNLDPSIIPAIPTGVYSSVVKYKDKEYKGALFYGPRLVKKETHTVLEIHIIDFDKEIYGEEIRFQVNSFIREVKNFSSLEKLKKQLEDDIGQVKDVIV